METKALVCPWCGNRRINIQDIKPELPVVNCPYCDTKFVWKIGEKLMSKPEEETKHLERLHGELKRSVGNNDAESIIKWSEKILEINSDDFTASYYRAYGHRRRNQAGYINDFYSSLPAEGTVTEDEIKAVTEHIILNSELNDYAAVEKFIAANSIHGIAVREYLDKYTEEYDKRLAIEANYFEVPRDVFVCHSSKNRELVEKITDRLEAAGRDFWISSRNLRPNSSENYWNSIFKAITSCKVFLLVYSADAARSGDVMKELEKAYNLKKPIIEINIDGTGHKEGSPFDKVLDGHPWIDAYTDFGKGLSTFSDRIFETFTGMTGSDTVEIDTNFSLAPADDLVTELEPSYDNGRTLIEKAVYAEGDKGLLKEAYKMFWHEKEKDVRCWFGIALCLKNGYGVERDDAAAENIFALHYDAWSKLASDGDAEAEYIMYECSKHGYYVFPNEEKAKQFLANAVKGMCARAIFEEAKDPQTMTRLALLKKAYALDYHLAWYELGNLYFNGDADTEPDLDEAVLCYRNGINKGDQRCKRRWEELLHYKNGFNIVDGTLKGMTVYAKTHRFDKLTIPAGVTSIAANALADCEIDELILPPSVVYVDKMAFGEHTVKKITGGNAGISTSDINRSVKQIKNRQKMSEMFTETKVFFTILLVFVGFLIIGGTTGIVSFSYSKWGWIVLEVIISLFYLMMGIGNAVDDSVPHSTGRWIAVFSFTVGVILNTALIFFGAGMPWWGYILSILVPFIVGIIYAPTASTSSN